MDKNGKIFGKISIIDLLAIIVVVLAVVGIAVRFTSIAAENVKEKTKFSYEVEIDGVREYSVTALEKKGIATDKYGNVIGEITLVEPKEKTEQTIGKDGESKITVVPDRYTVIITLDAEGKESGSAYFVGENTELSVGSTLNMYTKYANCSGKIIKVNKIENQG